jgi:hypothetical protein
MGGHGGLNILPQKSWNGANSYHLYVSPAHLICQLFHAVHSAVYGQRNRQRVAEDEEAHREKEQAQQKQRGKGDREIRLQVLRRQAGLEVRALEVFEIFCPGLELVLSDHQFAQDVSPAELEEAQDDVPVFEDRPEDPTPKHHINFWSSFETSERNPEREVRVLSLSSYPLGSSSP